MNQSSFTYFSRRLNLRAERTVRRMNEKTGQPEVGAPQATPNNQEEEKNTPARTLSTHVLGMKVCCSITDRARIYPTLNDPSSCKDNKKQSNKNKREKKKNNESKILTGYLIPTPPI